MTTATIGADGAVRPAAADPLLSEALIPTRCTKNHASFLGWPADGSLGCAGSTEGRPDVSIHFSRLPAGADPWLESVRVSRDDQRSKQSPVLAPLPNGDLWIAYTAQEYGAEDKAMVVQRQSTDLGATWTEVGVPDSTGAVHLCVVALRNGELVGIVRGTMTFGDTVDLATMVVDSHVDLFYLHQPDRALHLPDRATSVEETVGVIAELEPCQAIGAPLRGPMPSYNR